MKGFIKTDAIDGWLDKGNGITTVYMSNGMAVNIPTVDWLTGWNSNREIAESWLLYPSDAADDLTRIALLSLIASRKL